MDYQKKIVLITGSTRGIGKQIAISFAQKGATSIIVGRSEENTQKVCAQIKEKGFKADAVSCDISDYKNVGEMVNKVLDKHKAIDILVNNAGITKDNLLLRMTPEDWDAVININLKGVFNCTKVVGKAMLKAKSGTIINIASIIGITGNAGQANYAASKAGIIGFTKSIAREFASRGIRANAVAPGYIQTEMTDHLPEKVKEDILKNIPLKRLGHPQDVAEACLFLASDEASYITGQTIVVDGGLAI